MNDFLALLESGYSIEEAVAFLDSQNPIPLSAMPTSNFANLDAKDATLDREDWWND